MKISAEALRNMTEALLKSRNVPQEASRIQADILIEAELRGLQSHGLQRLPRLLTRIERHLIDPNTTGNGQWTRSSFLSIDGQKGLGPVVVMSAIEALAEAARNNGIAIGSIRNANHIGMLAYYVEAIAKRGLIGIVMSSTEALVHPYGGSQAMLGTNPIAIGIPTAIEPFILDLATSEVSMGKIHHHALVGKPIPEGWAVDAEGAPTTDATIAKTGAIAPFGGAKGYGLGLAIELLVAALAGSAFAPEVTGTLDDTAPANKGDLILLIDPTEQAGRATALTNYLDELRHSRASDPSSPVAVPGDGMRLRREKAMKEGIELPEKLYSQLTALAAASKHNG